MNAWELYDARLNANGKDVRSVSSNRGSAFLSAKLPTSLSYHSAIINGEEREIAVINSDNLDIKIIYSKPGEDLPLGGLMEFANNHWLINEKDANNEVYTKCKAIQCNYLLRWVDEAENVIVERWCELEDGTKYLTGEFADTKYIVAKGDARVAMLLAKDKYTSRFKRTQRFLLYDYDATEPQAFRLTKPLTIGHTYNGEGCYQFVLAECNVEDTDNLEWHIPNYYKYFPKDAKPDPNSIKHPFDAFANTPLIRPKKKLTQAQDQAQIKQLQIPEKKVWL